MHHSFDIRLAEKYSIEEAILIHHFQHWLMVNARLKRNFKEGFYWTYQSREQIAAFFPYWTVDQVRRYVEKLEKRNVLIKGNFNKSKMDRTKWYRLDYSKLPNGWSNKPNPKVALAQAIPDTKPYTKTTPPSPSQSEEEKSKEYKEAKERLKWELHNDEKIPPYLQKQWLKAYTPTQILSALKHYQEALNKDQQIHSPLGFIRHYLEEYYGKV